MRNISNEITADFFSSLCLINKSTEVITSAFKALPKAATSSSPCTSTLRVSRRKL